VIELYAITDDPTPPLPADARWRTATAGGLTAIGGPAPDGDGSGATTPDALWRHEAHVEALMAGRDLLPVRYGTRVADAAAAAQAIAERRDALAAALDRVRGAAEVAVRVVAAPACEPDAARVIADVHAPLAAAARESTVRRGRGDDVLRAAYLVDRAAVHELARLVGELDRDHDELRLLCTGPWPPYSFAG
jgi:hypothetical protein